MGMLEALVVFPRRMHRHVLSSQDTERHPRRVAVADNYERRRLLKAWQTRRLNGCSVSGMRLGMRNVVHSGWSVEANCLPALRKLDQPLTLGKRVLRHVKTR